MGSVERDGGSLWRSKAGFVQAGTEQEGSTEHKMIQWTEDVKQLPQKSLKSSIHDRLRQNGCQSNNRKYMVPNQIPFSCSGMISIIARHRFHAKFLVSHQCSTDAYGYPYAYPYACPDVDCRYLQFEEQLLVDT